MKRIKDYDFTWELKSGIQCTGLLQARDNKEAEKLGKGFCKENGHKFISVNLK